MCGRCLKMTTTRAKVGTRDLLLAEERAASSDDSALAGPLAAVEHLDLVEGVPGHVHVHAPVARALHRLLDLVASEADVVGPLHQVDEGLEELVELRPRSVRR